MKIKFKNTEEQVELIKAMGSRVADVATEAQEIFAAFVGPVIREVLLQAGTAGLIYVDAEFDEDDDPSFPLDLYFDKDVGHISVWHQQIAGGLPTSQVTGMNEMKFGTYRLDSAVSWLKKYARRARLDSVSKAVERMAQEVLVKQERNAWVVILTALAEANTLGTGDHINLSNTESEFILQDMSALITLARRINKSFANGTPSNFSSRGLTDMFVSPEIKEQIRGFAFNPINAKAADGSAPGEASDGIALDDTTRREIFMNAGREELYGITITDLIELGTNEKYNDLFASFAASSIAHGGGNFETGPDEILVGLDLSREAFIRPVARHADSGGTFSTFPDDQFTARSDKAGLYGFVEEGRICIDARAIVGLIV